MDNEERLKHQLETATKLWSGDITTLTSQQIKDIMENFMYQVFLIDVSSFSFTFESDDFGTVTKMVIVGNAFADSANLTDSELASIIDGEDLEIGEEGE